MTDSKIALRFVEEINAHKVDGLVGLMTTDHVFIDSLGNKVSRPEIETGWKQYFEMVPDYWIQIERTFSEKDTSILLGKAGGTFVPNGEKMRAENKWETPGVWLAEIRNEKVSEWRVYCDNEPIREKMRKTNS
jgi:SnoaL-like domain